MSDDRNEPNDRDSADGPDRDDSRGRDDLDSEELDERIAELEARVRELRAELGRPPEGPLGLPRPPTPREVLSFTGEYAIPTAIAVLEANIRALKALQQVARVLDPERSVVAEERDRLESRAAEASRTTLDRLESALEDVETTIREGDLPREEEARSVLEDARRINREIRDRVERERRRADEARERERAADRERPRSERDDRDDGLDGGTTIELSDESDAREDDTTASDDGTEDADDARTDGRAEVDVEAELRSIKDEIAERERSENDGGRGDRPNEPSADGDENADAEAEADRASEAASDGDAGAKPEADENPDDDESNDVSDADGNADEKQ
jgi:hypothetical protein